MSLQQAYWFCWYLPSGSCFSRRKLKEAHRNGFYLAFCVKWSRQIMPYRYALCSVLLACELLKGKVQLCLHSKSIYWAPTICLESIFWAFCSGNGPKTMLKNIASCMHERLALLRHPHSPNLQSCHHAYCFLCSYSGRASDFMVFIPVHCFLYSF